MYQTPFHTSLDGRKEREKAAEVPQGQGRQCEHTWPGESHPALLSNKAAPSKPATQPDVTISMKLGSRGPPSSCIPCWVYPKHPLGKAKDSPVQARGTSWVLTSHPLAAAPEIELESLICISKRVSFLSLINLLIVI